LGKLLLGERVKYDLARSFVKILNGIIERVNIYLLE